MEQEQALRKAVSTIRAWQNEFGLYDEPSALAIDEARFTNAYDDLLARLRDNYPFFHPRYVGQMLKPPEPARGADANASQKRAPVGPCNSPSLRDHATTPPFALDHR